MTIRPIAILSILLFAASLSAFAASPASQPATAPAGDLTRAKVEQYAATCERVWFDQAVLYRFRGARYASLDKMDSTQLFVHGYKLLVLTNERQIEESLLDTRDNPAQQWRRQHEVSAFDGKKRIEWTDFEDEALVADGGRGMMLEDPAALYAFYGFVNSRPLSALVHDAQEFYFAPQVQTINGEKCVLANCVYKSEKAKETVRYELALAVDGALFPMQIQRFIDRGQGEKRSATWEALQVEKDAQRHIWQLKEGRFFNLGTQSVYVLELLARREVKPEQDTAQTFALALPKDAVIRQAAMRPASSQPTPATQATRPSQPAASQPSATTRPQKKLHPEISFLSSFMGVQLGDLEKKLNGTYKNGFVPEWGYEVPLPVKK